MMLDELINVLRHNAILTDQIYYSLLTIQHFGNFATHDQGEENHELTGDSVRAGLHAMANLVNWYISRYLKTYVAYDIVAASRVEMPHTVVNDHSRVLQFLSAVFGKEIELIEEDIEAQVARTICEETTALFKTMPDLEQKILIMAFGLENSNALSLGTIALSLKMPHRLIHHQFLVSLRRLKHPARLKVLKKIMELVEPYLA